MNKILYVNLGHEQVSCPTRLVPAMMFVHNNYFAACQIQALVIIAVDYMDSTTDVLQM